MTHTYSRLLYHLVWSTKNRKALIDANVKNLIYSYMRSIIEKNGGQVIAINGMPDHVHLLVCLPLTVRVPEIVQKVKTNTTKWIQREFPKLRDFAWQEGIGAFTVGQGNERQVTLYIQNQEIHHETISFEEEYIGFLKKLNIAFDERFVLG